ncbi:MAG: 3-oxoacyl-ACP reductase [Myxococcales bacterium]|nr:3-oxoacyl-ACP reductase [Myxococcales bacterium]
MADRLVDLAARPAARKWITRLGLPVPLPQTLRRPEGPWVERPLADRDVLFGTTGESALGDVLATTLAASGANPWLVDANTVLASFQAAGEAWGRPPRIVGHDEVPDIRPHALVFDATGIDDPAALRSLFDFFHPRVKSMSRCGRCVVIGRPAEKIADPARAAAQGALEGFVRSLGKEVGRGGSTAQLVTVQEGAEDRLPAVLRFLLSDRSAYISGQPIHVSKTVRASADVAVRALEGKVALVTGAARGIGRATAHQLALEGAHVIVLDRPEDDAKAAEVAAEVGGSVFLADVTDATAGERLADHIREKHGAVDVIVHNAGITRDRTLAKMQPERWDQTIDVNLASVIRLTEQLDPVLGKNARIVCLSSIAGIAGNVGQTNYAASKAGVIGFVRAASTKYARRGIAVNAIAPGFIETRLTDAIPVATREVARRLASLAQGGQPWDIAQAVTFLASPGAASLCGQTVRVCGGNFVGA